MPFLFIFVDGVGLGPDDPASNPFAVAKMPVLSRLLGGKRMVVGTLGESNQGSHTERTAFYGLDAVLGVSGRPQSASGQAAIITGKNVPRLIGEHYGPKPNPQIRSILQQGSLFGEIKAMGRSVAMLNAFPQAYFEALESGRRLPGAFAMAYLQAGLYLKTTADLIAGQAISADFTGEGWHTRLKISEVPIISAREAGIRLARLAAGYDFAFFEYWLTDYAGHQADLQRSRELLENFDEVLGGLVSEWDVAEGLILITSDHGNLEEAASNRHSLNLVPALIIGDPHQRAKFPQPLQDLTDIAPAILHYFTASTG